MQIKNLTEIFFATGNKNKITEMQSLLPELKIKSPLDAKINFAPNENGKTFFENAIIKAKSVYEIVKMPVIADDSGLCVVSLNDAPGIYSSRYAGKHADTKTQDKKNNEKLLSELSNKTNRNAYFVCCLILYLKHNRFVAIQEICEGEIIKEPRGENGFGYDPLFFISSLDKTMAELSTQEKNKISHRGKALTSLKKLFT
ncbi:MAG: RdgB/HAM1 family non-canonical purine NTP pyrophosphatase [Treponemataceae bacterium]